MTPSAAFLVGASEKSKRASSNHTIYYVLSLLNTNSIKCTPCLPAVPPTPQKLRDVSFFQMPRPQSVSPQVDGEKKKVPNMTLRLFEKYSNIHRGKCGVRGEEEHEKSGPSFDINKEVYERLD